MPPSCIALAMSKINKSMHVALERSCTDNTDKCVEQFPVIKDTRQTDRKALH